MDLVVRDAQPQRESFSLQNNSFYFLKAKTGLSSDNAGDERFVEKMYFDEIEVVLHDNFPEYTRLECLDYQVRLDRNEQNPRLKNETGTQKKLAIRCTARCCCQKRPASSLAAQRLQQTRGLPRDGFVFPWSRTVLLRSRFRSSKVYHTLRYSQRLK